MSAPPAADRRTETLAGVPVRCFEPANPQPGGVVWLADFDALTPEALPGWTEPLARRGVRVVCPLPGPTWWLDRPDPAFKAAGNATAWAFLTNTLAPWAAGRFGGPVAWAGAGAGGAAAVRAGFRLRDTPAVWACAPAVSLDAVHGRGSTLDGLFPTREAARRAGVLTAVNPLARPRRLRLACDPGEVWFPGCELLADKLRSGGVPLETDFAPAGPDPVPNRGAALEAAGPRAVGWLADALAFMV